MRDGNDLFVVTQSDAWRARAISTGQDLAKIWVGDVGVWTRNPEYVELPSLMARASLVTDPADCMPACSRGSGPSTRTSGRCGGRGGSNGPADGSRVLIRYQPV